MLTAGDASFKAFQKLDRFKDDISERNVDVMHRRLAGEDLFEEFADLMKKKDLASTGMAAMMKLNQKTVQRVLDESR